MIKDLVKLTQELVKIKSISGEEEKVAQFCMYWMKKYGFDEAYIGPYGAIIGIIKGKNDKTLYLDAHIDNVPVSSPDRWKHNPYGGELDRGKIYGRGTSDMKGSVASIIWTGGQLVREKDRLAGTYIVGLPTWEEFFEGYVTGKIIEHLKSKKLYPDYAIICESTSLAINIGQRGRGEVVLESFGKPVHSGHHKAGINAVLQLFPVMHDIEKIKPPKDILLGEGPLVLTDIKSSPYPGASVVPEYCKVTYDRRLMVGETPEKVLAPIKEIIEKHKKSTKGKITVSVNKGKLPHKENGKDKVDNIQQFPLAWKIDPDHLLVKKAKDALKSCGLKPSLSKFSFCTDGSYTAAVAKIPTIGFGPSREDLAHTIDEYIEIDQLEKAAKGYFALAKTILA